MWQRARFTKGKGQRIIPSQRHLFGKEVWVKAEPPISYMGHVIYTDRLEEDKGYETNIYSGSAKVFACHDKIEFLARGPEDFAENIPTISLEEWEKDNDEKYPRHHEN